MVARRPVSLVTECALLVCLFLVSGIIGALLMDAWKDTLLRLDIVEERIVDVEVWKDAADEILGVEGAR